MSSRSPRCPHTSRAHPTLSSPLCPLLQKPACEATRQGQARGRDKISIKPEALGRSGFERKSGSPR